MLYVIHDEDKSPARLSKLLKNHPEIQFVSLLAVDFGNNHTDEKIPVNLVIDDLEDFFKNGIQTDGSSVYLPEIASINNGKIDLIPDMEANWIVDYNYSHPLEDGKFCGSLIFPAMFLMIQKRPWQARTTQPAQVWTPQPVRCRDCSDRQKRKNRQSPG